MSLTCLQSALLKFTYSKYSRDDEKYKDRNVESSFTLQTDFKFYSTNNQQQQKQQQQKQQQQQQLQQLQQHQQQQQQQKETGKFIFNNYMLLKVTVNQSVRTYDD
jgi:hypothetical protein